MRTLPFFLIFAAALVSCGIGKKNYPVINPESDDALLRYGAEWAVIVEPYAVYKTDPDINALPGGYGRIGDVEQIIGRAFRHTGAARMLWYRFEKGWLPGSSIAAYSNKLRAQKASSDVLGK